MLNDHVILEVCTDCLCLIANGDTSGTERCETPEGETAYLDAVAARTGHYRHICPTDWPAEETYHYTEESPSPVISLAFQGEIQPEDVTFDLDGESYACWTERDYYYGTPSEPILRLHSSCDTCGDPRAGDRHPVAAFYPDN